MVELVLLVIDATGVSMSCVMVCAAAAEQPLADVTVTVYDPGEFTESVANDPRTVVPLDQE